MLASCLPPATAGAATAIPIQILTYATTREAESVLEAAIGALDDFQIEAYNEAAEPRPSPVPRPAETVILRLPQSAPAPSQAVPQPIPAPLRPAAGAKPPRQGCRFMRAALAAFCLPP